MKYKTISFIPCLELGDILAVEEIPPPSHVFG